MSDITTFKIHIRSVISTRGKRYAGWDIRNYYLETTMLLSEYMIIHIRLIPPDIIAHYNSNNLVDQDGWVYMKIIRVIYGMPQAGILAKTKCEGRVIFQWIHLLENVFPVLSLRLDSFS